MQLKQDKSAIYQLEHYLFKLICFINSPDYQKDTKSDKQREIIEELFTIEQAISNIRSFVNIPEESSPYVGWEAKNKSKKDELEIIYRFSCKEAIKTIFVMESASDFNTSLFNGNKYVKKPWKGWWFMELDKYIKTKVDDVESFNTESLINYINIEKNEKKATKTDGNV